MFFRPPDFVWRPCFVRINFIWRNIKYCAKLEVRCRGLNRDNIRHGLSRDLGFLAADRAENVRRIGEVARLMVDAGLIVIASFISPDRVQRDAVRARFELGEFHEVHVSTPLHECERRDPKCLSITFWRVVS
jgi:adenylylsulfate kinase-like enzyme